MNYFINLFFVIALTYANNLVPYDQNRNYDIIIHLSILKKVSKTFRFKNCKIF